MADRPWLTPEEVQAYSEYTQVQQRSEARLAVDIMRAEEYIISYTNNRFTDYEAIPPQVKTAALLLAEAYAYNSSAAVGSDGKSTGGRRMKSESFDDYSYTSADDGPGIDFDDLDVKLLLDPYIVVQPRNGVTLRMRKL